MACLIPAKRPTLVLLSGGERLELLEEDSRGVLTKKGWICWDEVEAFLTWHMPTQRYMSIPIAD